MNRLYGKKQNVEFEKLPNIFYGLGIARNCRQKWKWFLTISKKGNKFLAIPSLLYVRMELPGSGCTFKMYEVPGNFNLYIVSWKLSGTGVFFKIWPKHSKKSQKVIPGNFWLTYSRLEIARNYNFFIIFGDFWEIS